MGFGVVVVVHVLIVIVILLIIVMIIMMILLFIVVGNVITNRVIANTIITIVVVAIYISPSIMINIVVRCDRRYIVEHKPIFLLIHSFIHFTSLAVSVIVI